MGKSLDFFPVYHNIVNMDISRIYAPKILSDLEKKMVIVTGPRQVGKTWISKKIATKFKRPLYLNYDNDEHREIIDAGDWDADVDLLILDEIHRKANWKRFVKGVYDTKPASMRMLITGSARLDVMQNIGESMAGRFFVHHILPLSVAELNQVEGNEVTQTVSPLTHLLERSGFPEPFLASQEDSQRWHTLYLDSLIRADVLNFATVDDLQALTNVVKHLQTSVASSVSYSSIAQNIGKSPETVKRYIQILSDLYIIFIVRPFSHKINRAILKEPKIYFYDTALVSSEASRLENLVALELLKDVRYRENHTGIQRTVHYVRTKENKEVDFLIAEGSTPLQLIEVKQSDITVSKNLRIFSEKYDIPAVQIVRNTTLTKVNRDGVVVQNMAEFLGELLQV